MIFDALIGYFQKDQCDNRFIRYADKQYENISKRAFLN